ncbi:signal recognition particle subunit SRP14 [Kwoniella heveanensis BCC8398]|uniref:Signal recognition particle subunit SRP14 n=1 Tax=Kwoniella heveanensis BCC8398 TaxID=1296120 RepID=A0A1B9GTQ7_9TREE|nr:signal recognition particle subunit SRP14 [Kwoniella heveanensis BCC8398]
MPQQLVSPEEFLTKLEACFSDPSSSSSVWLTHKRLAYSGDEDVHMTQEQDEGEDDQPEYEVLIRCTQGDNKFSAKIPASSLSTFHATYGSLLKSSFAPLMRKRDKKKEKARAEALTKKRREVYTDVIIGNEGKRGKGRRQRMRKIKAQKKKESERERLENLSPQQDKSGAEL